MCWSRWNALRAAQGEERGKARGSERASGREWIGRRGKREREGNLNGEARKGGLGKGERPTMTFEFMKPLSQTWGNNAK